MSLVPESVDGSFTKAKAQCLDYHLLYGYYVATAIMRWGFPFMVSTGIE